MKLKKIDATGGTPQDICDVQASIVGGAWSPEGVIVFGNAAGSSWRGLFKVSAYGGVPSQLTSLDSPKESAHILRSFLPDGRHFVYVRFSNTSPEEGGTYIGSIDEPTGRQSSKMLMPNHATVVFSPSFAGNATRDIGYLLYLRDSTLVSQPFDTRKLEFAGEAVPVANPVGRTANDAIGFFSVSQTGVLVYRSGNEIGNQISWLGRDGKSLASVTEVGNYTEMNLSPDARTLVISAGGAARHDLYILDLMRNINTRFTFEVADDRSPVWSPDGKQIVFTSAREGQGDLYLKSSSQATSEELLYKSAEPKTPNDWSSDGRFLLFTVTNPKSGNDIWYLPMMGERKPKPFVQTPFEEGQAQFSPDGRFVAYSSNESSDRGEIYVRSFPDGSGKWQISGGGGVDPHWRRDGKEILYRTGRRVMAVEVMTTPTFAAGSPKLLFEASLVQTGWNRNAAYTITGDGTRLLAALPAEQEGVPINVVVNWQNVLKR